MFRRVSRAAGLAAHGPGVPAAADDVAVPAKDRVWGNQQPQSLAPPPWYHAKQGRYESRSAQFSFGRRGCRRCAVAS